MSGQGKSWQETERLKNGCETHNLEKRPNESNHKIHA